MPFERVRCSRVSETWLSPYVTCVAVTCQSLPDLQESWKFLGCSEPFKLRGLYGYKPRARSLSQHSPDLRPFKMSTDPTTPQPRRIVLCFDGTSNQFDETVSHPHVSPLVRGRAYAQKRTRTQTSSNSTPCSTSAALTSKLFITRSVIRAGRAS